MLHMHRISAKWKPEINVQTTPNIDWHKKTDSSDTNVYITWSYAHDLDFRREYWLPLGHAGHEYVQALHEYLDFCIDRFKIHYQETPSNDEIMWCLYNLRAKHAHLLPDAVSEYDDQIYGRAQLKYCYKKIWTKWSDCLDTWDAEKNRYDPMVIRCSPFIRMPGEKHKDTWCEDGTKNTAHRWAKVSEFRDTAKALMMKETSRCRDAKIHGEVQEALAAEAKAKASAAQSSQSSNPNVFSSVGTAPKSAPATTAPAPKSSPASGHNTPRQSTPRPTKRQDEKDDSWTNW